MSHKLSFYPCSSLPLPLSPRRLNYVKHPQSCLKYSITFCDSIRVYKSNSGFVLLNAFLTTNLNLLSEKWGQRLCQRGRNFCDLNYADVMLKNNQTFLPKSIALFHAQHPLGDSIWWGGIYFFFSLSTVLLQPPLPVSFQ